VTAKASTQLPDIKKDNLFFFGKNLKKSNKAGFSRKAGFIVFGRSSNCFASFTRIYHQNKRFLLSKDYFKNAFLLPQHTYFKIRILQKTSKTTCCKPLELS
jgi:hypothetical protein